MSGSESNGTNPGEDVQNLPRAPINHPKPDPRLNTYYGRLVGNMKGGKQGALCCEHEVSPYDPDERPHKERTPFRHYLPQFEWELTNQVSAKHFGNRSGLHILRRIGTWGHLSNVPSVWAIRLAIWHAAIEPDDSLLQTAVSVCLAENQDKRKMLHVVTHPSNMQWLSNELRLWAATAPQVQETPKRA